MIFIYQILFMIRIFDLRTILQVRPLQGAAWQDDGIRLLPTYSIEEK